MFSNAFYRDESALQMKELISKHFTSENELALWSKEIYEKVIFAINRWKYFFYFESESDWRKSFQNGKNFPEFPGCLYIAIKAQHKIRDRLSGKYYLHSLHYYKNMGAYVREPGEIQGFSSRQFFLAYARGTWYITESDAGYEGYFCHTPSYATGWIWRISWW